MKRLVLVVAMLGVVHTAYAAELLVKAKPHWKDAWTKQQVDALNVQDKASYDARSQIGDIIVVRPDGWKWGKEECLPNYVVVKVPELKYEEAKKYEQSLMKANGTAPATLLKVRQYAIPKTTIEGQKLAGKDTITLEKAETSAYIAAIEDKSK